ncbi:MAG: hypothetical protein ACJ0BU_10960 [Candidatus Puniceispirillales bacterium]
MNKFSFFIVNFIASAVAVLLTTVFILIWQSSSILFNLGGLPQIIEDELSKEIPGSNIEIEDINFSVGNIRTPFGIKANKITISNKGENLKIEKVSIYFSLINILSGNFKSESIILDGLDLSIKKDAQNKEWITPNFIKILMSKSYNDFKNNKLLNNFRNADYSIINSKIYLENNIQVKEINNINFKVTRVQNNLRMFGDFNFDQIKEKIKLSFIKNSTNLESSINLIFQSIEFEDLNSLLEFPIDGVNFTLNGNVNITLDSDNNFNTLNSSLNFFNFQDFKNRSDIFISYLDVDEGSFDIKYKFKEDVLNFYNIELLNKKNPIINGAFELRNLNGSRSNLYVDLNSKKISSDIIPKELIPKDFNLKLSNGSIYDLNFRGNILIENKSLKYIFENYKIEGAIKDLELYSYNHNEKIYNTLINGAFELRNLKDKQSKLYINLTVDKIDHNIITKNLFPDRYNLKLSNGIFRDLSLIGNIFINNESLDYVFDDFEINGVLNKLNISSNNENENKIESLIETKFVANLKDSNLHNLKAKSKVKNFKFLRKGMSRSLFFKEIEFDLDFKDNKIKITNLNSSSSENNLISGELFFNLSEEYDILELKTNLKSDKISYAWLTSVWPNDFGFKTKNWIKSKVNGGFGEDYDLQLVINPNEPKVLKLLNLTWLHKNSEIKFYKNLPVAILPEAFVNINENEMLVTFKNSSISDINIDKGEMAVSPIFNKKAKAKINLEGTSKVKGFLNFLNKKDLDLLSKYKIGTNSNGKISFKSNFKWPVKQNIKRNEFFWDIDLYGKNLNLSALPFNLITDISSFKLKSNNTEFNLLSEGKINNIDSEFKFIKKNNQNPDIRVELYKSVALAKLLENFTKTKLAGEAKGLIEIYDFDFKNFKSKVLIELSDARVEIPFINYVKQKGLNGLINGDLEFINKKLVNVSNINGEIGSIAFDGNLRFKDATINGADFNYISLPGTLISNLNLIQNDSNDFILNVASEKINLKDYMDFLSIKNKEPIRNKFIFNINSEQFILPGGIEANGKINGILNNQGGLNAKLEGEVDINDEITINEIELFALLEKNRLEIEGEGLINSTPIKLVMEDGKDASSKILTISGDNAGDILRGFNVTKLVEGGKVKISVFLNEENYKEYSALIDVSKFNVTNAPILVRLISTLSLTGLLNLLEEKGIYFERGFAKINNLGNIMNLENIEAVGEAMAISLDGWVNKKDDKLQIHGTIAPATLLNKLLEPVPLLSDLLIGGDKAGIVLTEFRLDGSIKKPTISFRPLSSAPGLLRDIFNLFRSDLATPKENNIQN